MEDRVEESFLQILCPAGSSVENNNMVLAISADLDLLEIRERPGQWKGE